MVDGGKEMYNTTKNFSSGLNVGGLGAAGKGMLGSS